jgi:hypothetical protein
LAAARCFLPELKIPFMLAKTPDDLRVSAPVGGCDEPPAPRSPATLPCASLFNVNRCRARNAPVFIFENTPRLGLEEDGWSAMFSLLLLRKGPREEGQKQRQSPLLRFSRWSAVAVTTLMKFCKKTRSNRGHCCL